MKTILTLSVFAGVAAVASAGVGVETYGSAAPPSTVAGVPMSAAPFRSDIFADTTAVSIFPGFDITFSTPVSVRAIGSGWASWSHGYTGNAFYSNGAVNLTMTMPIGIGALQFYAEPNPFGVFSITATGSDGSSSISATQPTEGSAGATGWGFYGTAGSSLASITLSCDVDFAVGEFATMIPAPNSAAMFTLPALAIFRRRR